MSHQLGTFISSKLFDIFLMIYVDDGELVFESNTYTERVITLFSDYFIWFGSETHIGTGKNPQKLNASSSPLQVSSTYTFYRSMNPLTPS